MLLCGRFFVSRSLSLSLSLSLLPFASSLFLQCKQRKRGLTRHQTSRVAMGNFWKCFGKCSQGCSGKSECSGGCSGGCSGEFGVLQGVLPRVLFLWSVNRKSTLGSTPWTTPNSPEHHPEHPRGALRFPRAPLGALPKALPEISHLALPWWTFRPPKKKISCPLPPSPQHPPSAGVHHPASPPRNPPPPSLSLSIYIYIYMAEASFSAYLFGFLQGKNSIF